MVEEITTETLMANCGVCHCPDTTFNLVARCPECEYVVV